MKTFSTAIDERKEKLKAALKVYGTPMELDAEATWNLWSEFRTLSVMPFSTETSLWRISALPTKAAEIVVRDPEVHGCGGVLRLGGGA